MFSALPASPERPGPATASCLANVVVETPAGRVTPPLSSGLLAGTFRAELLARGEIRERVVSVEELCDVRRFFLVNSVRGWCEAFLVPADQGGS